MRGRHRQRWTCTAATAGGRLACLARRAAWTMTRMGMAPYPVPRPRRRRERAGGCRHCRTAPLPTTAVRLTVEGR